MRYDIADNVRSMAQVFALFASICADLTSAPKAGRLRQLGTIGPPLCDNVIYLYV